MKRLHTYSQHFLRSPQLVSELVNYAHIRKNDLVYDLGAGSGVITSVLAGYCRQVVAVEVEPQALAKLRVNMSTYSNVSILNADILDVPIPSEPYRIVANIPFSLSAAIVRKFTESSQPPQSMHIIVQKQFARKLVPGSDHFTSQLSAQMGPRFTVIIRHELRRSDYTPPPAVDTVLLEIKLRREPWVSDSDMPKYRAFVERCFAEQKFFPTTPRAAANISPELRPSELSLMQWSDLFTASLAVKVRPERKPDTRRRSEIRYNKPKSPRTGRR